MKRKLNSEELTLSMKSMEKMKEEMEYNEYQLKICELKLGGGLMQEHKKQMRDYKRVKKDFSGELEAIKSSATILQDQIRNGVEIKQVKGGKNE